MISSELAVQITFDDEGKEKIIEAKDTLINLHDAFDKAGWNNTLESEYLDDAIHLLIRILDGEVFN